MCVGYYTVRYLDNILHRIIYCSCSSAAIFINAQTANLPPEALEASASFDPSKLDVFVVDPILFIYFFVFSLLDSSFTRAFLQQ